jgi:WD40 repeat protein/serine/threonine protein kinase
MHWQIGEVLLGLYEVQAMLGAGATGRVYRVRHLGWEMELALKVPRQELLHHPSALSRFVHEAETWVRLGLHPHTASCHYVRRIHRVPAIFYEYVDGGSLAEWVAQGWLYRGGQHSALRRMLDVAIQSAWGLAYAHSHGLIHQDVKPGNILVGRDGTIKVTDFGLARTATAAAAPMRDPGGPAVADCRDEDTLMATCRGLTRVYAAPEQLAGRPLTRRADLWGWAVSLLHLFNGRVGWSAGDQAPQALERLLESGSPAAAIPSMPAQVATLLRECLQPDARRRPRSMDAVAARLVELFPQLTGRAYERRQPPGNLDTAESLNNRAASLMDLGRPVEAEALWEKALRMHPHHPEATYNLARCRWRSGAWQRPQVQRALAEMRASQDATLRDEHLSRLLLLELDDAAAAGGQSLPSGAAGQAARLPHPQRQRRRLLMQVPVAPGVAVTALAVPNPARCVLGLSSGEIWRLAWRGPSLRRIGAHAAPVTALVVPRTGDRIVSGDGDGALMGRDLVTGEPGWVRDKTGVAVTSLGLDAGGRWLLAGEASGGLVLMEAASGRPVRRLDGHGGAVTAVALSPDGRLGLSAGIDGQLVAWRLDTGGVLARKRLGRLFEVRADHARMHAPQSLRSTPAARGVAFGHDGRHALVTGDYGLLLEWELAGDRLRALSHEHQLLASLEAPCLGPDGGYLLTLAESGELLIWKRVNGRCVARLEPEPRGRRPGCLALTASGLLAVTGDDAGRLSLWSVACRRAYAAPQALCRAVSSRQALTTITQAALALTRAREHLARGAAAAAAECLAAVRHTGGHDRTPEIQELWASLYRHLPRRKLERAWERAVLGCFPVAAISPDGGLLALGGRGLMREGGVLHVVAVDDSQPPRSLVQHRGYVGALAFTACGRYLLSGSHDHTLIVWDLAGGLSRCVLSGHHNHVTAIAVSADGAVALSGSGSLGARRRVSELMLWNVNSGRGREIPAGHRDKITAVALDAEGRWGLSGSLDGSARLYDLEHADSARQVEFGAEVCAVGLSPDGRRVAIAGMRPEIWLLEREGNAAPLLLAGHAGGCHALRFSRDGRWLISGGADAVIRLWDMGGRCLRVLSGHGEAVAGLDLSWDDRLLVSAGIAGRDGVRLWEFDWALEPKAPARWDEAARPYLEAFLRRHPHSAALNRHQPDVTTAEFRQLLFTLGCVGLGWLLPEGIAGQLLRLRAERGAAGDALPAPPPEAGSAS